MTHNLRAFLRKFSPTYAPGLDICRSRIYIDALLGIGLNRAPEGVLAEIIETLNTVHDSDASLIVALDIASGLDADGGQAPGVCVTAHHTMTFLTLKAGLLTGEGPDRCRAVVWRFGV